MMQPDKNGSDLPPPAGEISKSASAPPRREALREEEAEIVRPTVERAILLSGQHDRKVLASALASVVGMALRRSITGVFKRIILGLNRFLVQTFSIEGIRWRFEALRTGKPFQQVVQEHSLTCPVTQVFLIHRRTGLLIEQVQQESTQSEDGDMMSGMLTAIQDFVHDSFQATSAGQLEVIRVGDVTVLLEQGPLAILAGIINQGFAPQNLRKTFRQALEQIHDDYHQALVSFRGGAEDFEDVHPILEACLKTRLVKGEERISPLTGMILIAPLIVISVWGFFEVQQSRQWRQYLVEIGKQPGLVVVETGRKGRRRYIHGLRDPLAQNPVRMLVDSGIVPEDVISEWESYQALDSELVLERAKRALNPPASITLELRNGTLFIEGSAPWYWVEEVPHCVTSLQGVSRVRSDGVQKTGNDLNLAWNRYLTKLAETPGILVLEKGRWNDSFYIAGMRDPMAPDPTTLLHEVGLNAAGVRSKWEPFQALHPSLMLARSKRMLAPPRSVEMTMKDGALIAVGTASHTWISEARLIARAIAGVSHFDTKQLQDTDMQAYEALVPLLENQVFYYLVTRRDLWPGQEKKFKQFIENVSQFSRVTRRLGGGYHIEICGHARDTGEEEVDLSASLTVAESFYLRLQNQHVDMGLFEKRGMGGESAPAAIAADVQKREAHISFRVVVAD